MALVICPFVTLATIERREAYLPLLEEVCKATLANEPGCLAYCWMRQSPDSIDPTAKSFYVRGLEMYANEDALAVTHRSGEQYKQLRATVAAKPIITWPVEGLEKRTPTGVGFLSKSDSVETLEGEMFASFSEFTTSTTEAKLSLLNKLETLSQELRSVAGVLSFFIVKPSDPAITDNVLLFNRYDSSQSLSSVSTKVKQIESWFEDTRGTGSVKRLGVWEGAGFGFIRSTRI